jgi:hypothetical protein
MHVVEGGSRRIIRSGLIGAALEQAMGPVREVSTEELDRWAEGDPVEVLELPGEAPFVVVGGVRRPLRGFPVPHPVEDAGLAGFPQGPQLDVASANVARSRYQRAQEAARGGGDVFDRGARLARRGARKAKSVVRRFVK